MRMIYGLVFLLGMGFSISSPAAMCPDFSGTFKMVDEFQENYFKITATQDACKVLTLEHDQGWDFTVTYKHILDGKRRLVEQADDFKVYETSTINETEVMIKEDRFSTSEDGIESEYKVDTRIYFNVESDLVMERTTKDADGSGEETSVMVFKRQHFKFQ